MKPFLWGFLAASSLFMGAFMAQHRQALVFPPQGGEDRVLIDRVIDGDTVKFFHLVEGVGRLHGINAPEKGTEPGKAATAHLAQLLPAGSQVQARFMGRDKYGRLLVELGDVNRRMVADGFAVPWDGRGQRP